MKRGKNFRIYKLFELEKARLFIKENKIEFSIVMYISIVNKTSKKEQTEFFKNWYYFSVL